MQVPNNSVSQVGGCICEPEQSFVECMLPRGIMGFTLLVLILLSGFGRCCSNTWCRVLSEAYKDHSEARKRLDRCDQRLWHLHTVLWFHHCQPEDWLCRHLPFLTKETVWPISSVLSRLLYIWFNWAGFTNSASWNVLSSSLLLSDELPAMCHNSQDQMVQICQALELNRHCWLCSGDHCHSHTLIPKHDLPNSAPTDGYSCIGICSWYGWEASPNSAHCTYVYMYIYVQLYIQLASIRRSCMVVG